MTDEQKQEIMRRYNEGMCNMTDAQMAIRAAEQAEGMRAMSTEEMARRQLEAADGARQRGPLTNAEQDAMRNFWGATADAQNNIITDPPPTTLWARFKRWVRA